MINIEKFQSEIQKNMQAMVNEYRGIIRENRELKHQVKQLEKQTLAINVTKTDKDAVVIFAAFVADVCFSNCLTWSFNSRFSLIIYLCSFTIACIFF